MLKNEREREIMHLMKAQDGFVSVKELCHKLFASESSIRRDLTALESRGLIKRSYGGAELLTDFTSVTSFAARSHLNVDAKKAIAKKAAALVRDGNILFLDQSSTSFYLATALLTRTKLTVITNNIEILYLLSGAGMKVLSAGGYMSPENRNCLIGPDAERVFSDIYADFVFFSAKALSSDGIISDCTREEVTLRYAMFKNAAKKVFLCDSEKFDTTSAYRQCSLREVDYLVSEVSACERFRTLAPSLITL